LKNVEKVVINKAVVLGKKTPMLVYNENEPKAVSK